MADRYCWSGASGANNGTSWANAYTSLVTAAAAVVAGDRLFVADDHAETKSDATGTVTLSFASSFTSPTQVLSVNRTSGLMSPGASFTVSTAHSLQVQTTTNGMLYFYGLALTTGAVGGSTQNLILAGNFGQYVFERCNYKLITGASSTPGIYLTNTGTSPFNAVHIDCSLYFSHTGQFVHVEAPGIVVFRHTGAVPLLMSGSAVITNAFVTGGRTWALRIEGVDFTGLSSTAQLIGSVAMSGLITVAGCKVGASQVFPTPGSGSLGRLDVISCDSGTQIGRNERYRYGGTVLTETTVVRSGGATDGTTPFSHKVVGNANNEVVQPVDVFEGALWNDATGSAKTLTVELLTDNVTLTDRDVWLEVDYPGDASSVMTRMARSDPSLVATAANLPTSSATWTTTGLATPVKQKVSATFTPQQPGAIRFRVVVSRANVTVYVDPKAELA